MTYNYRDKYMLITGAAGGIAGAFIGPAAERGATLLLVDMREERLDEILKTLPGTGHRRYVCDLTEEDQVQQLIADVDRDVGRIDVLINNVGTTSAERFDVRSIESIKYELDVNLVSPLVLTRLAVPVLRKAHDPRVVTTVSLGGIFPLGETPIYTASKFGLRGAMLSIGLDLRNKGITAGSVLPSATDTRMLRQEAIEGGNSMQFQDPPQHPSSVATAMMKLLDTPKLEVYPKFSESLLVRFATLFPNTLPRIMPLFRKRGERGMRKYLKELERDGHVVQTAQGYKLAERQHS